MAKQILSFGSAAELERSDGETHLHQAVELGDLEFVQMLVKAGADPGTNYQGHSLADLARIKVRRNHDKCQKFVQVILR